MLSYQMLQQLIDGSKQQQFNRYSEAFNFFLAKPISLIVTERCVDFVVRFKDQQFLIDESQYLKRYYAHQEVHQRIQKLTEFYEESIPHPMSNLIPTECYPILQKRQRKLIKLMIKREREHEGGTEHRISWEERHIQNEVLMDVDKELESWEEDDSFKLQKVHPVLLQSFDSSIHNIYEQCDEREEPGGGYKELIDYSQMRKSPLIMDFKLRKAETAVQEAVSSHTLHQQEQCIDQPKPPTKNPQQHHNSVRNSEQRPSASSTSLDRRYVARSHHQQPSQPTAVSNPKSTKKSFMEYYYSISPKKTNILNSLYKL